MDVSRSTCQLFVRDYYTRDPEKLCMLNQKVTRATKGAKTACCLLHSLLANKRQITRPRTEALERLAQGEQQGPPLLLLYFRHQGHQKQPKRRSDGTRGPNQRGKTRSKACIPCTDAVTPGKREMLYRQTMHPSHARAREADLSLPRNICPVKPRQKSGRARSHVPPSTRHSRGPCRVLIRASIYVSMPLSMFCRPATPFFRET